MGALNNPPTSYSAIQVPHTSCAVLSLLQSLQISLPWVLDSNQKGRRYGTA